MAIHKTITWEAVQNQILKLNVYLQQTGLTISDVSTQLANENHGYQEISLNSFTELGNGEYMIEVPASAMSSAGVTSLYVSSAYEQNFIDFYTYASNRIDDIKTQVDKIQFSTSNYVKTEVNAIESNTQDNLISAIWSYTTRTLTSLGSSAIQAIWDFLTSNLTTAGSIGKLLVDNIDEKISTVKSNTDGIKATTDNIQFDASNNVKSAPQTALSMSDSDKNDIADKVWDETVADHTTSGTMGKVMQYIRGLAVGKRKITNSGANEELYDEDNSTLLKTFNLTQDSEGNITERSSS